MQHPPVRLPPFARHQGVSAGEVGRRGEAAAEDVLSGAWSFTLGDHCGQGGDHDLGVAVTGFDVQAVEEFVAVGERLDTGVVEQNADHAAWCSCPRCCRKDRAWARASSETVTPVV